MMHAGGGADDEGGADAAGAVRAYFLEALEAAGTGGAGPGGGVPGSGHRLRQAAAGRRAAHRPGCRRCWPVCRKPLCWWGASRKRVVGMWCGNPPFEERLPGTLAIHTLAQWNGAHILRVHECGAGRAGGRVADACRRER